MRRVLALLAALIVLFAIGGRAHADHDRRVPVRVLEIAGDQAYLSAGVDKGVRVGSRVRFDGLEYRVQRATRSFAVVSARKLHVGDRGTVEQSAAERANDKLRAPRALDAFAGQWPAAVKPASTQEVKRVPLGHVRDDAGAVEGSLTASGAVFAPLDGKTEVAGRGELRGVLRISPVPDVPLVLAADVAVQRWFGRYATGVARGDPRPFLRVRELMLSLGQRGGYRAELGRVRYAAENLGPLDGARFEAARWGALRVSAFGGLLPDPIDGRFDRGAGRFGLELNVRGDSAVRPELTMVAHGSVFDGKVDEQRLFASARLFPGDHHLSAYAEAAAYDEDNPWQRPRFDLTAAGADADLRFARARVGARFDMRTPERSNWLASALPATWLCASSSALVPNAVCTGGADRRYVAQAFAGFDLRTATLDVGGSWAGSSEPALGRDVLGHATLRSTRIRERYDLALGASYETGTLLRTNAALRAEAGVGSRDDRVHLSVYYRPAYRRYEASIDALVEHGLGLGLHGAPNDALSIDVFADARLGDVPLALVMLLLGYRL